MQFRFLRTESFRLTAIFAALLVSAMLILMTLVYFAMHRAFQTEMLLASDHDLATVQKAFAAEGLDEAKEVIGQLLAKASNTDFLILESPSKGRLAGNLLHVPAKAGEQVLSLPRQASSVDDDGEHQIIGRGAFIAPDIFAFSGRDLSVAAETEEDILHTFGWVLAATLVLALAGGIFVSNSFLGRMDAITRTCRAIMAGRLSDRIPERGTKDELDRLVSTINAMLDRISGLMENVKQISSDIAHDLRTPLTRLRHHLEQARNESTSAEEYGQAVDRAISDSDNMLSIFSALLSIGQIEGASGPFCFTAVNVSQLVTELAEIYQPVAADSGRSLNTEIEAAAEVSGNRELLSQMILNLIENAITHTPLGTLISIELKKSSGSVVVTLKDNGYGIPSDEWEKVFRRFYRLERARTHPGSGLGLSLVRAIADYHGANIVLRDNKPGLCVTITFPITQQ